MGVCYHHGCSPGISGIQDIEAFDKNGLKMIFSFVRPDPTNPTIVAITLKALNANTSPIYDFIFQAAIPKVSELLVFTSRYYIYSSFFNGIEVV